MSFATCSSRPRWPYCSHDDDRHVAPNPREGANLRLPHWADRRSARFDIVDRDYLPLRVSQNDISSNAGVQPITRQAVWIETLLHTRAPYAWKIASSHNSRKFRVNENAVQT